MNTYMSGQIEIRMICHIDSSRFSCLCLHLHMQTIVLSQYKFHRCGYLARISFMTIRWTVLECYTVLVYGLHLPVDFVETNETTMQLMFIVEITRDLYVLTQQWKPTICNAITNPTHGSTKIGICRRLVTLNRKKKNRKIYEAMTLLL